MLAPSKTTEGVPGADFTRDLGTSHGSLRGTLVHVLWADWIWLQRWRGESPKQVFDENEFADAAAFLSRREAFDRDRETFLSSLRDGDLSQRIGYENRRGERWVYRLDHMLQHVVNHATFHRGQVVTLLRQIGHVPPATDYLVYFDEGGQQRGALGETAQ
jgi:uncharacterized damage-inducible protein DinB